MEMEKDGSWTPVAEEYVLVIPGLLKKIMECKVRAEAVEDKAKSENAPALVQASWLFSLC